MMSDDKPQETPPVPVTPQVAPDTHSKRIRFRKTETSRLKAVGDTSKDTTPSLPTAAKPAPPPAARTGVVDPMALRDTNTSKVKRVQAAKDSSPLATVSLPGVGPTSGKTETVQLKVVQQKKKELEEETSASSTVRLRAPGAAGSGIEMARPRPSAVPRDTMKVSLPKVEKPIVAEEPMAASTVVTMAPPPMPSEPAPAPAPRPSAGETTQRTMGGPAKTSTQVIEKPKAPPPPPVPMGEETTEGTVATEAAEGGATVQPTAGGGARTLKLRTGAAKGPARTVRLKTDGGQATVAVQEVPEGGATIKVEDAPAAKGGLKLRTRAEPLGSISAVEATRAPSMPDKASSPGVVFTVAAAATVVALGVTSYFLVTQVMAHIL